ncbi:MAG TPA: A/G-specific adenine glycosylase [Phycisphaerae bacterium]|nr:A/G-specific adenine glycosylase [Phycisphaerae bacterium]
MASSADRRKRLRRRLLAWFRKHRRDMPWRRTRDPYAIWVAEVLLQQTQVPTALPYYKRFLKRFPTVAALARASDQAVLKVWEGLGYYRRALNLLAAARLVVRDHAGRVPDDPERFARLPGVGRYTCGAVQSIAFGRALAAVDGNAVRVLARWFAIRKPVTDAATHRLLWDLAEALVPPSAPGDWNQAVMELGSTVCTPRTPQCQVCPVRRLCEAAERGIAARLPVKRKRKPIPHIEVGAGIVWRRGKILMCKRPAGKMLAGLWEFPGGKRWPDETIPACIRRELKEECDLDVEVGRHLVDVTHTYSHLKVTLRCYHCRAPRGRVKRLACDDARWVRVDEIPRLPLPAADLRILQALGIDRQTAIRATRNPRRR